MQRAAQQLLIETSVAIRPFLYKYGFMTEGTCSSGPISRLVAMLRRP